MDVFKDKRAFATTILIVLIDAFGTDVLDWDAETIRLEVKSYFHTEIEDENMDKLMSGILILSTDGFYRNLNQFIATCNALSGTGINNQVFDPATVEECAWGVTEAILLNPDFHDFSDEINSYVGVRLEYEGWGTVPKILRGAVLPHGESSAEDFSNDPSLFAGVWGAMKENERLLDETLAMNKQDLLNQISSLKIKHGSYDNLIEAIKNNSLERRTTYDQKESSTST
jgi:hypothetical protein